MLKGEKNMPDTKIDTQCIKLFRKVREKRKSLGITQAKLAKKIGVTKQTISSYETFRIEARLGAAMRICQELGINISDFIEKKK